MLTFANAPLARSSTAVNWKAFFRNEFVPTYTAFTDDALSCESELKFHVYWIQVAADRRLFEPRFFVCQLSRVVQSEEPFEFLNSSRIESL